MMILLIRFNEHTRSMISVTCASGLIFNITPCHWWAESLWEGHVLKDTVTRLYSNQILPEVITEFPLYPLVEVRCAEHDGKATAVACARPPQDAGSLLAVHSTISA